MEMFDIKKLKINKYYRQPIGGKAFAKLKADIMENGIKQPLLVDKNNTIIDGMIRFEIAKSLGYTKVPIVYVKEANV